MMSHYANQGLRVLVVDDCVDGAQSLALLLRMWGHEARVVHGGPAALEEARAWRPDVVLLDIGMPGLSGYAVAERLAAAEGRKPLLVALTGYGGAAHRAAGRRAGFDHYLVKPVAPEALREVLDGRAGGKGPMRPDELAPLLTSLTAAADVVEAIDSRALQERRGWDLEGWRYELVPWGVRFVRHDAGTGESAALLAVALPAPPARGRPAWPRPPAPPR